MDYVYSRIHTGYDAIVLAYRQPSGDYNTYWLGSEEEKYMFTTSLQEEQAILSEVQKWVRHHLPAEDELVLLKDCSNAEEYREIKESLQQKGIAYEAKGKRIYVRQGDREVCLL